ncbi:MAG: NYN domain-containing protein [Anaerolineae bacterium]|nr:NYN domain-containing protein [Anaerolineae bacterium]
MKKQTIFNPERRIAMLIDGDNAQYSLLKQILEETSRHGEVTIRRAYGDWTAPNLSNWRSVMLTYAIQPIQQWRYTTGKNATDSALIIDAMDILYSGTVQGFCVVSSDSDYTRLCTRIREDGLFVMGIGREKTPEAFINACNVFVYIENLIRPDEVKTSTVTKASKVIPVPEVVKEAAESKTPAKVKKNAEIKPSPKKLLNLLRRAFDISAQDDEGWVHLGALGNALQRLEPSFDSRTYGFKSLSLLIKSLPDQVVVKGDKKTGAATIYVKMTDNLS